MREVLVRETVHRGGGGGGEEEEEEDVSTTAGGFDVANERKFRRRSFNE